MTTMNKLLFLPCATAAMLLAQPAPPPLPTPVPDGPGAGAPMMVEFLRTQPTHFAAKAVKGVPYAAEGVNESTQVLADGNRITRKSSSSIYRDSQGRTRNEHSLGDVGPWASRGEKMVNIFDPVAKVSITLHPDKTATKFQMPDFGAVSDMKWVESNGGNTVMFERKMEGAKVVRGMAAGGGGVITATATAGAPGGRVERDVIIEHVQGHAVGHAVPSAGAARASAVFVAGSPAMAMTAAAAAGNRSFKTESLGKKVFEGVEADGTRTVSTIAAGEIGNERDIEIVDETWYSKELEALVYSRHSDPRTGETSYRLTNIRRGEQPIDLFEVPSDYKVQETGKMDFKIRTKKLDQ
jgi:hypothetical protein